MATIDSQARAPRPSVAAPGPAGRNRARIPSGSSHRAHWILLAPFLTLFTLTLAVPVLYAVGLSLFSERRSGLGFGGAETVFAGIGNYLNALSSPQFRDGFVVLAFYVVLYIPIMGVLALLLALLLDSGLAKAGKFFQVALFLPHAVPGIVAAIIWAYLYTPGISPVLGALSGAGLELDLFSHTFIVPSIVNIVVWEWTGYNVIIFYTALKAIDREIIEAAHIDGATGIGIARHVKVPLIAPAVGIVVLFTIIGALQLFSEPMILAQASSSVNSTFTPNMYAYQAAFGRNDFGQAAASSVLLAALAGGLSWLVTRFTSRKAS